MERKDLKIVNVNLKTFGLGHFAGQYGVIKANDGNEYKYHFEWYDYNDGRTISDYLDDVKYDFELWCDDGFDEEAEMFIKAEDWYRDGGK